MLAGHSTLASNFILLIESNIHALYRIMILESVLHRSLCIS